MLSLVVAGKDWSSFIVHSWDTHLSFLLYYRVAFSCCYFCFLFFVLFLSRYLCVFTSFLILYYLGAKFKKYVGHSAHVTNVRFTSDSSYVISVGGADNAIFQWQFLPTGEEVEDDEGDDDEEVEVRGGGDSDSELSDSDMSDVEALDSDLEKEKENNYER